LRKQLAEIQEQKRKLLAPSRLENLDAAQNGLGRVLGDAVGELDGDYFTPNSMSLWLLVSIVTVSMLTGFHSYQQHRCSYFLSYLPPYFVNLVFMTTSSTVLISFVA